MKKKKNLEKTENERKKERQEKHEGGMGMYASMKGRGGEGRRGSGEKDKVGECL